MIRYTITFISFWLYSFSVLSQIGEIKGTIKDANTNETIIGASVMYGEGKGTVTDLAGNYSIKLDSVGTYNLTVSYVGYDSQKLRVKISNKPLVLNFSLTTTTLNEVEVVADVAKTRETPIAFSNVSQKQIEEELGARDLPMVLNSTPGVYATEQGGGVGDSRINVRGFEQTNVAVMVDGVPMNDMENGAVYWSDWVGLSDITSTLQIQRGLGASKLAIPSIGGTINVLTRGIDQKMSAHIKEQITDYGLYKTSFDFNSGQLKGGWGVTLAGSRQYGTGWADGTYTDAWNYYAKIQKRFKKHLISISANGGPQSHGVRKTYLPIAIYSQSYAEKLGIDANAAYATNNSWTNAANGERGLRYNPDWGEINGDGGTSQNRVGFFTKPGSGNQFNNYVNYFDKPLFNLSHFWSPNDKLTVSTIAYLSIGKGGETALKNTASNYQNTTGQLNVQTFYDANTISTPQTQYSSTLHPANNYLRTNHNEHFWYGAISSWNYKVNKNLSTLIGIDGRYYQGSHFQTVYNLMGSDYVLDFKDYNQPKNTYQGDPNAQYSMKYIGDKVNYYNDSKVYWGGLFAQAEYKKEKWKAFITATLSDKGYQRIDYFAKRDLIIPGNNVAQAVGWGDSYYFNGTDHILASYNTPVRVNGDTTFVGNKPILNATRYTSFSPEAHTASSDFKWFLGYSLKGGANYNITDQQNVFINLGYINVAPPFNNVFDNSNHLYLNIHNQYIYSAEGGYGFKHQKFAANINLYYTLWKNKPFTSYDDALKLSYNVPGLDELHKGVEIDYVYKIIKNLDLEGIISVGDFKYTSAGTAYVMDDAGRIADTVNFNAKNVHVGNAAQIQYGASLKYNVLKGLYIKPRFTYFAKNYAWVDVTTLSGPNGNKESWKMPNYGLLDLFMGYGYKVWKMKLDASIGVVNLLNSIYISDAKNNSYGLKNYDAASAGVYMGMGRRITASLKVGF